LKKTFSRAFLWTDQCNRNGLRNSFICWT